MLNTVTMISNV